MEDLHCNIIGRVACTLKEHAKLDYRKDFLKIKHQKISASVAGQS